MAIRQQIENILDSGHGNVRGLGTSTIEAGSSRVTNDPTRRIDDLCWDAVATINPVANTIEFRAVAEGAIGANAVIIGNQTEIAATGQIRLPQYKFFYSDFFSGCIFFLFRDPGGALYGVHSYKSSGTYANPIPYFFRKGARLLYCYETAGIFSPLGPGVFGSVICYATPTTIHINFFAMTGDGKVNRVVDRKRIDNWPTAGIATPDIAGALAPWKYVPYVPNLPPQPPAKVGLKKKIQNFYVKYIK